MANMTRVASMVVLAAFVIAVAGVAQASGPAGIVAGTNLNAAYQWSRGGQPGGSYQQTCRDIRVSGNKLEANCQKKDGSWRSTSLDLSDCRGTVDNEDGHLRCSAAGAWQGGGWNGGGQPRGSYRETCQNIRMNGNRLEARCQKSDGGWRDTSLDYNQCRGRVRNEDGHLRCDNSGGWNGNRNWQDDDDARNWRGGQPRGSYVQTCQNIRMNGNRLEARCQKSDGSWRDTSLDYSQCRGSVANDDGHLRCDNSGGDYERGDWGRDRDRDHDRDHDGDRDRGDRGGNWGRNLPSGSYRETCQNVRVNGNRLDASCQKKDGGWRDTSIDLGRCNGSLANDDGHLRCGH